MEKGGGQDATSGRQTEELRSLLCENVSYCHEMKVYLHVTSECGAAVKY
jgi:hypothetical protein